MQTSRHGILEGRRALDALVRALLPLVSYSYYMNTYKSQQQAALIASINCTTLKT